MEDFSEGKFSPDLRANKYYIMNIAFRFDFVNAFLLSRQLPRGVMKVVRQGELRAPSAIWDCAPLHISG